MDFRLRRSASAKYPTTMADNTTTPPPPPPEHVPGGRAREPTLVDGLKSVQVEDLAKVYKVPCARESLLIGIAAGFVFGGVKLVFKSETRASGSMNLRLTN